MRRLRVLVLGGYGFFGQRLVQRLSAWQALDLLVAGRSLARAKALADGLRSQAKATLDGIALDAAAPDLARQMARLKPDVLTHASGPFQGQQYQVAQACLASGTHYIDLADGRDFVSGITRLNAEARAARLALISGASSVPAISSAAAMQLARGMIEVDSIEIGISPGNRTERGLATIQAVLSYCGKPLPSLGPEPVFGWSGSRQHIYPPPVGARLLSPCDVPDLSLLSQHFPGGPLVSFGAGLELRLLHRGMNAMAALGRWGWVHDWSRHARLLKRVADLFKNLGSDAGAMHVSVGGRDAQSQPVHRAWQLLATQGHGPYVPTLAAAALLRKLLHEGPGELCGAQPCVGLLTLSEIAAETQGLQISMSESKA